MLPGLGYYCGMSQTITAPTTPERPKKKRARGASGHSVQAKEEHAHDLQALAAMGVDVSKPFIPYAAIEKALYGRPPKYDDAVHPAAIYERMTAPLCLTREAAALSLGIATSTLYAWADKYDRFSEALRAAEFIGEAYHAGRLSSGTIKYAQGLIFYMKNRHGWKDKSEIEHTRKVDDLVKDADTGANRVGWSDIVPSSAHAHTDVVDAEILDDTPDDAGA